MKRFSALTATALLSSIAFGQEPAPPPETTPPADATQPPATSTPSQPSAPASAGSIFDTLDTDKNGGLAEQEANAHPTVAQNFAKADTNSDGSLSREEFLAAFKGQ